MTDGDKAGLLAVCIIAFGAAVFAAFFVGLWFHP